MAFLSTTIAKPTGLWEWLILTVFDFVANYGWRIVLFTVLLKVLLSPLDIYQRYTARKNQKINERLKPQLEKLKKQYPDKTEFAQKQAQLNKKEGVSMLSSCLPAIVTLVIFFTLLSGLNSISAYMNFKDYYELHSVYDAVYTQSVDGGMTEADAVATAQDAVYDAYHEGKTSFLWIKNIWSPDVPWKNEVNDFSTFKSNCGDYAKKASESGISQDELSTMMLEGKYNLVMGKLLEENDGANGYLVLPVLAILLSVATQIISQRQQKKSGMNNEMMNGGMMKAMIFIMPILIGIFSLSYTSAFTLYLVVQYAISLMITLVSGLILYLIDKREEHKKETEVVKYGRPDPNDK